MDDESFHFFVSDCVFRTDSTTHFGRIRPRVSGQIDHQFRMKSTSRFG